MPGARTLAAHQAVVALCEREGVQYAALSAQSAALGIDLALLDDQVAVIREVLRPVTASCIMLASTSGSFKTLSKPSNGPLLRLATRFQ